MEWCQRHHEPGRRAIRVRDNATLPSPLLLLALEHRQVIRVHLGHQERHVRRHAVGAGIGDDEGTALGECLLQRSRDIGIERGEDDATGQWRLAPLDHHPGDRLRYRSALPPADNFAVRLPGALFRRCYGDDLEPGMPIEQLHELLPNGPGGAQNGDRYPVHHSSEPWPIRSSASFT